MLYIIYESFSLIQGIFAIPAIYDTLLIVFSCALFALVISIFKFK